MKSLAAERIYPYVVGAVSAVAWLGFDGPFPEHTKEFLAASISFAAILTGFIATAQSILMALPSESIMGQLRRSGYIADIVAYMREAILGLMMFALVNVVGFFFDPSALPRWYKFGWMLTGVTGLLAFYRVTSITAKIMQRGP